jgi:mRNA-degrading endonuclease RelE of RelBE toxin-antitoxin system
VNDWKVELRPVARRGLRELPDGPRQAAADLIAELAESGPKLTSAIEMRANPNTWRIAFYDRYRMVYQVSQRGKQIIVTRIGLRSVVYRGMKH